MASWITHLRIAEALQRKINYGSYEYFLIGNVAPDSGRLNEDRLTYRPEKKISHFQGDLNNKWRCEDLRYYRSYIMKKSGASLTDEELSFHYGYFIHLIVDRLWTIFIYRPVKYVFKEAFENDPLFGWELKKDWHGLDVEYLLDNKDCAIFDAFKKSFYNLNLLEFYPQEYIQSKLEEIKNNFHVEEGFSRPNKYLSKEDWELFISTAPKLVLDILNDLEEIESKYSGTAMEYLEDKYCFFEGNYGDIRQATERLSGSIEPVCYYSWFESYLERNMDKSSADYVNYFSVKKEHTYRVRDNIVEIGRALNLDDRSIKLCEIIGLFHDLGRFKQYIKYGTFDEKITGSHAKLSIEVLQEENPIYRLDNHEKEIVIKAIEYHNYLEIPEDESNEVKLYCRLIRDADKLDAFYNEIYEYENRKGYLKRLSDEREYSEEILEDLLNRRTTDFKYIKYKCDRRLAILACIFGLYFNESIKVFCSKGYLSRFFCDVPKDPEIIKVRENCEGYINEKLNKC
jgi:hypothetical protein